MSDPASVKLQVDQSLDLRGIERVAGYAKAREQLQAMAENQVLELYLDEGEPLRSIPFGLRADGHEIVVSEPASPGVRLLVRKRTLLQ
ncbi:MAG: sulfurtransferase TusA family protein [Candidatus Omnitrophica bacterium]|nr:sulfurtransferase TusA family protein [Candidatus Omnitrophota bacterium]